MNSVFLGFLQRTNNKRSFLKAAPATPSLCTTRYLLTRLLHLFVILAFVLTLSACGGGGSGGGGGGGGGGATYTVGGDVSGLDGTVVLQNNLGDDLSITANGTFTFSTAVADGGAYAVTVSTQPSGQTCSVSSGSGTVSANVTDVSVACSTNTYTVGGEVSGLDGTLVLQNNSGDNKAITANGSFTFATPIAYNGAYDVSVLSRPVLQNCAVSSGSGTVNANITNVSATCENKVWSHPADTSAFISPAGDSAWDPQAAMDGNGNAIIVWYQSDGSNTQTFMSEYRSGSWTHPSSLTDDHISPDTQDAALPQVAMDDNGNAIIVWRQYDGSKWQIYMSEYRSGSWTHPSSLTDNISPDNGQTAEEPQVAMDDNGNAIIVWHQYNGSNYQIYMSEYRSGSWTHPSSLTDNISIDGQTAEDPQVAMDNNGNALIVWKQYDGSKWQIYMSEYRSGSWAHPTDLANNNISIDTGIASAPQVAMDNNGNAIIVWKQYDGSNYQIYMSEYRSGSWAHPTDLLTNAISIDGQTAYNPQVAMDDNGNAIIVWRQPDGSNYQIYMSEYNITTGSTWTHPSSLTDNISPDPQVATLPQVAMDGNGDAIIVWQEDDVGQIFFSEFR